MAKSKTHDRHVQVELRRSDGLMYHTWLPARYAVLGKYVDIKMDDGQWLKGMQVYKLWASRSSAEVLSNDTWKTHRDGTDRYRDSDGTWVPRRER